jgi:hypothetical protein
MGPATAYRASIERYRFGLAAREAAARKVPVEREGQPVVIADYGSSQGKNSLAPMGLAIRTLANCRGRNRSIFVFHTDLELALMADTAIATGSAHQSG